MPNEDPDHDVVPTRADVRHPPSARLTAIRRDVFTSRRAARIAGTAHLNTSATAISSDCMTVNCYEASEPDGAWKLEDILGPGATHSLGMAHHEYDIRHPDRARRPDHSHPVIR